MASPAHISLQSKDPRCIAAYANTSKCEDNFMFVYSCTVQEFGAVRKMQCAVEYVVALSVAVCIAVYSLSLVNALSPCTSCSGPYISLHTHTLTVP